jgi:hypothetical protein
MSKLKDYDENVILNTPIDDLVGHIIASNTFQFPELRESETWIEENEVTRDVPMPRYDIVSDTIGSVRRLNFHTVIFHVPFDGDGNLFLVAPSTRSLPGPAAVVNSQELIVTIGTAQKTREAIRR